MSSELLSAELRRDLSDVESLAMVRSVLEIICRTTGMRFSAVARVTDTEWTALAVRDGINFGLVPGDKLDLRTTLCMESRAAREPVLIEHATRDPVYCDHHTPRIYGIQSYVSVPIVLADDEYFGNLCAIDPEPAAVKEPHVVEMFTMFAGMLASQLNNLRGREAAEQATALERAIGLGRERFVAVLGHDLRTPLAAMSAGVAVLQRSADRPDVVKLIASKMQHSAGRMRQLVDDLMDYARGRFGGGFGLNAGVIDDLDAAFAQVIEEVQLAHPDRPVDASFTIGQSIRGDRARLQQLLSNLVINAVTHGHAGTAVSVQARVVNAHGAERLVITVANCGDPIASDRRNSLFDAFSYEAPKDKSAGLGLGLFICSEIVKSHGGELQVLPEEGNRIVFQATLPL